jgi:hypothetical protein
MLSYLAKMEPLSIVNSTKLAECLGQSKKGYRKDISPTLEKNALTKTQMQCVACSQQDRVSRS